MRIIYISHALVQMEDRGLSKKDVEEAIIKGQERHLQSNGRVKCTYRKKDKTIIVVYKQNKNIYKVITAYYPHEN